MAGLFFGPKDTLLTNPEGVIPFLGKGEKHWKKGRSAYEAAYSWFSTKDLPDPIREIFKDEPVLRDAVLKKAIFEKRTKLDEFGHDSQTDIVAYLDAVGGPAVLSIEAKVDETFGPLVSEWNDGGTGKLRRLVRLIDLLEIGLINIAHLRYQLFHRVAATVIEARKVGAKEAAMIVQSFDNKQTGFDDFRSFASAFGTPISGIGRLSPAKVLDGVTIRLGWTQNSLHSA